MTESWFRWAAVPHQTLTRFERVQKDTVSKPPQQHADPADALARPVAE